MFSIVDAVLLRRLPYRNSDRLVVVWQSSKEHRSTGEWFNTYSEFEDWERNSRSFEKLAALSWAVGDSTLGWHGKARNVLAIPASVDFFSMLGVPAAIGRTFEQQDLNEGCTTVLSHAFWQNELGAPADLVGQSITLDQRLFFLSCPNRTVDSHHSRQQICKRSLEIGDRCVRTLETRNQSNIRRG